MLQDFYWEAAEGFLAGHDRQKLEGLDDLAQFRRYGAGKSFRPPKPVADFSPMIGHHDAETA